ncbi:MAG: hypothetical protein N2747_06310 [Chitinophagaceae bacterium]|nr:hypothetical protein [Chitinophagaceae bacterium]
MKSVSLLFFLLSFALWVFTTSAQRPAEPRRPSRTDSITFFTGPYAAYLNSVYNADVIQGKSEPKPVAPNAEMLCFDKTFVVKMAAERAGSLFCLMLNTKDGFIGYNPLPNTRTADCELNIENSRFNFNLIGLAGVMYHYFATKKVNQLEYYVKTSNTDRYQYNISTRIPGILTRKTERRDYCGGKVKARAYKKDGDPAVYFLFGQDYPPEININNKAFLGNFGVGYLNTDKGLFIIMEVQEGAYNAKIEDIQVVQRCFDPTKFKKLDEETFFNKEKEIEKKKQELDQKQNEPARYSACQAAKNQLLTFQKQVAGKKNEALQKAKSGNQINNPQTQQAIMDYDNPEDAVEEMILETKYELCTVTESNNENPDPKKEKKINCLQQRLSLLQSIKSKMNAIEGNPAMDKKKKHFEKIKIFSEVYLTPVC